MQKDWFSDGVGINAKWKQIEMTTWGQCSNSSSLSGSNGHAAWYALHCRWFSGCLTLRVGGASWSTARVIEFLPLVMITLLGSTFLGSPAEDVVFLASFLKSGCFFFMYEATAGGCHKIMNDKACFAAAAAVLTTMKTFCCVVPKKFRKHKCSTWLNRYPSESSHGLLWYRG